MYLGPFMKKKSTGKSFIFNKCRSAEFFFIKIYNYLFKISSPPMSEAKIDRYKSRDSLKNPPLSFHPKKPDPFLKDLDDVELYEWAHLKLLKANRLLKKKKQTETVELLKEIVEGIDFKTWDSMKLRISEEIKIPAMKKLRFLLLNAKNYAEALDIAEKVRFS